MIIDPYCERPPVHYLVLGGFDELVLLMFTRDCIVCVRPVAANTIDHVCLLQHLVVNQVVHAVNCLKRWLILITVGENSNALFLLASTS